MGLGREGLAAADVVTGTRVYLGGRATFVMEISKQLHLRMCRVRGGSVILVGDWRALPLVRGNTPHPRARSGMNRNLRTGSVSTVQPHTHNGVGTSEGPSQHNASYHESLFSRNVRM